MNDPPLVDSHLDLAENVTLFGRDLTTSVAEIRKAENRTARPQCLFPSWSGVA